MQAMNGRLVSISILLFVGTTSASNAVVFRTLLFPDGETRSSSYDGYYHPRLILQEGAIVDIICKSYKAVRTGPLEAAGIKWFLGDGGVYHRTDTLVDQEIFPVERNFEKYHPAHVFGSKFENPYASKVQETVRYTARIEDHGKYFGCQGDDLNGDSSPDVPSASEIGNHLHLTIRPGPAPLTFKSKVVHKWRGGFVGKIDIPISEDYTSWKMVINFPEQVYDFFGGPFQVASGPCLQDASVCEGDEMVIYNTFSNRVQNPGDTLRLLFLAKVVKGIDEGLEADVHFYGFNQVFFTHVSSARSASSEDYHVL